MSRNRITGIVCDKRNLATLSVRPLDNTDAESVAALSGELGYPSTAADIRERMAARSGSAEQDAFVVCVDGIVAGWIDVAVVRHLQTPPYAEICGLVIAPAHRGAGLGRALVSHAEQWAIERGVRQMLVRSQVKREDAHRFYRREGYEERKRQVVFTKPVTHHSD